MPGTNIPIVNEKECFKKKPEYLLLLSWHISKSLIKIFRKKGFKGKFIIPLPIPHIVKQLKYYIYNNNQKKNKLRSKTKILELFCYLSGL